MKDVLPTCQVLGRNEMDVLHDASLEILENVGMVVLENTCYKLLEDAGAIVDPASKLVKISRHLVEEGLKKTPKGGRVHFARISKYDFKTGEGQLFFRGGTLGPHLIDIETGAHRSATRKDFVNLVKFLDAMDTIHAVMFPCAPCDVSAESFSQQLATLTLENTAKPIGVVAHGKKSARDIIRLSTAVAGGIEELTKRPILQLLCEPLSPLKLDERQGENLVEFAEHKLPVEIASMPAMCSTAPATMAATIAQLNAEHLCMILIAQLINPGTPISLNACAGCMDPRTGTNTYGAVERVLLNVAVVQLWRSYYGIETYASAALTDSKLPDEQAGYERMMNMLLPALAGLDMITTLGYLESYLTISFEQILIDNEIASMILRILRGVEINEETLALDVIEKVGPGQHFLAEKHTLRHVNELLLPKLANRSTRADWERGGGRDIAGLARERARLTLEAHEPEPLEKDIRKKLHEMSREVAINSRD